MVDSASVYIAFVDKSRPDRRREHTLEVSLHTKRTQPRRWTVRIGMSCYVSGSTLLRRSSLVEDLRIFGIVREDREQKIRSPTPRERISH